MWEMKESGVEWIGQVPCHWKNDTIRHLIIARDAGAWGENAREEEEGTICLRIADFDYEKGIFKDCDINTLTKRLYPDAQVKRLMLEKGDILIEKSGGGEKTPVGRAVIFDKEYQALFANFMERLRFNGKIVIPEYAEFWLRAWYSCRCSPFYINQTTGIQNIDLGLMLAKERLYYPPVEQQKIIVSFLDAKCAEIDALTADIQTQINTLEQYKRSVITEAVTRGLSPDAEMRDSGIEWLGGIPSAWKLARIGSLYALRMEKVSDREYKPLSVTKFGIVPQLDTAAKTNAHDDRKLVRAGDFVINSRSDRRGSCGISEYDGSVSLINTVLYPIGKMNPKYYNWLFHTIGFAEEFYRWGHGIVDDLWTTGWQDMKNIIIVEPPLEEQAAIAAFLDKKCAEIDTTIAGKQAQLETLADYKKSLIFEYVTGKKEVPAS